MRYDIDTHEYGNIDPANHEAVAAIGAALVRDVRDEGFMIIPRGRTGYVYAWREPHYSGGNLHTVLRVSTPYATAAEAAAAAVGYRFTPAGIASVH